NSSWIGRSRARSKRSRAPLTPCAAPSNPAALYNQTTMNNFVAATRILHNSANLPAPVREKSHRLSVSPMHQSRRKVAFLPRRQRQQPVGQIHGSDLSQPNVRCRQTRVDLDCYVSAAVVGITKNQIDANIAAQPRDTGHSTLGQGHGPLPVALGQRHGAAEIAEPAIGR